MSTTPERPEGESPESKKPKREDRPFLDTKIGDGKAAFTFHRPQFRRQKEPREPGTPREPKEYTMTSRQVRKGLIVFTAGVVTGLGIYAAVDNDKDDLDSARANPAATASPFSSPSPEANPSVSPSSSPSTSPSRSPSPTETPTPPMTSSSSPTETPSNTPNPTEQIVVTDGTYTVQYDDYTYQDVVNHWITKSPMYSPQFASIDNPATMKSFENMLRWINEGVNPPDEGEKILLPNTQIAMALYYGTVPNPKEYNIPPTLPLSALQEKAKKVSTLPPEVAAERTDLEKTKPITDFIYFAEDLPDL